MSDIIHVYCQAYSQRVNLDKLSIVLSNNVPLDVKKQIKDATLEPNVQSTQIVSVYMYFC